MENNIEVFNDHVTEYEEWFEQYPFVFQSEIEALREMLPEGENLTGIEVGLGTGRYSVALNIKEGIEPARNMRAKANQRGVETMDAVAELLPYGDLRFDFVLMVFCVSYFKDVAAAFKEANRVLKNGGSLVVGFLDQKSTIGKLYEQRREKSTFYHNAIFYTVERIEEKLKYAGFRHLAFNQTLFGELDAIQSVQMPQSGVGQGSFVVAKAMK